MNTLPDHNTDRATGHTTYWSVACSLLYCVLWLSACASYAPETTIISYSYDAADHLIENIDNHTDKKHLPLTKGRPVLVTSFVELGQLQKTSDLGRLLAEQIASRINQKGYSTVEVKLAQEIFIRENEGEFALSRSLTKISNQHAAQAIVVGTYSLLSDYVYVTAKIVHADDGHVYTAYDFAIPKEIVFAVPGGRP